jgi:hypothetical protein
MKPKTRAPRVSPQNQMTLPQLLRISIEYSTQYLSLHMPADRDFYRRTCCPGYNPNTCRIKLPSKNLVLSATLMHERQLAFRPSEQRLGKSTCINLEKSFVRVNKKDHCHRLTNAWEDPLNRLVENADRCPPAVEIPVITLNAFLGGIFVLARGTECAIAKFLGGTATAALRITRVVRLNSGSRR